MVDPRTMAWPVAHMMGGGGWHWGDVVTALLVLIAVVGLMLLASGRRVRARAAQDLPARPAGRRIEQRRGTRGRRPIRRPPRRSVDRIR